MTSIHFWRKNYFITICLILGYAMSTKAGDSLMVSFTSDFEIDGAGTAKKWEKTDWVVLQSSNAEGETNETKVKLLYSKTGIYFLFWCEDNKITATLKEDFADLYNEDVVEVFLWTNEAHPVYFEYELSPLNYELPIMVPNLDSTFFGWRPWHYEGERLTRHATKVHGIKKANGAIAPTFWTAEFFIPYALLKPLTNVPPVKGTRWRANMYRLDYDQPITSRFFWRPIRTNFHDYPRFGTLIFN